MNKQVIKDNKKYILIIIVVTVISIFFRVKGLEFESKDFLTCLERWFQIVKDSGGIAALKLEIGDYNIPYMVILALLTYVPITPLISIKIVSIIFDYVLASAIAILILKLIKEDKNKYEKALIGYSLIVLLPTVFLNSSYWAQCDSIYVSFAIISIIYLIDEKYVKSFIFLGIAFAFKLQIIFMLPVYVLIYISKKKYQIYHFLIIPIVNCIMCLPAILCGRSVLNTLSIYFKQTGSYNNRISLNFPGVYNIIYNNANNENFISKFHSWLPKVMILVMMCIFAAMALYIIIKKVKFSKRTIITAAIWSVLLATFILPYMHERYMYIAEVLSVVYFIINRKKQNISNDRVTNLFSLYIFSFFIRSKFGANSAFIRY